MIILYLFILYLAVFIFFSRIYGGFFEKKWIKFIIFVHMKGIFENKEPFSGYLRYFAAINCSSFPAFSGGLVKKLKVTVRRVETRKAGTSS